MPQLGGGDRRAEQGHGEDDRGTQPPDTSRSTSCLQSAAQPVHQEPYGQVMVSTELVGGLVVHVLGESRQGCVSDVIHPGPAKHLHDVLTGIGHEGTTPLTDTGSGLARPGACLSPETMGPGRSFPA